MPARIHRQFSAESPLVFRQPQRFSGEPRFCGDTALSCLYLNGSKKRGLKFLWEKLLDAAALSQQVLHQHLSRLPGRMPALPSAAMPRQLTAVFTTPVSLPRAAQPVPGSEHLLRASKTGCAKRCLSGDPAGPRPSPRTPPPGGDGPRPQRKKGKSRRSSARGWRG